MRKASAFVLNEARMISRYQQYQEGLLPLNKVATNYFEWTWVFKHTSDDGEFPDSFVHAMALLNCAQQAASIEQMRIVRRRAQLLGEDKVVRLIEQRIRQAR